MVVPILTPIEPERFHRREKVAPGYYFLSPYQSQQETLLIYDNDQVGDLTDSAPLNLNVCLCTSQNLIFSGFGAAGPGISHAPQVCDYNGEPHLCFYQGTQMLGWGHGHGVIMDKHYRFVRSVEPSGSYQASSDMHEFKLINGGKSALMTQYLRSAHNLCQFAICEGFGYIQQGAFQEIDVETGKVLFEWKSLDHVAIDESYVLPGTTEISGSGMQPNSPWDYFHINSIDKNDEGDYLVSARHVSAVYKISGKDGHVIWRLNGAKSDYHLLDFSFSFQHDARFVVDNEKETILTIFDNGSNGFNQTQPHSTGIIVRLDHHNKLAYLIQKYDPPRTKQGGQHVSKSQGNFQQLPDGNVVIGWGNDAFWTEYTKEGEIIFYGHVGIRNTMNYRVHKFNNWVGLPLTKPALWTYSQLGGPKDPMYFYVSWNGATEVKWWKFYYSDSKRGPWTAGPEIEKNGFESTYRHESSSRYSYAEALDKDRSVLGTSDVQEIFIPAEELRTFCDELACQFMPPPSELDKLREQQGHVNEAARLQKEREQQAARDALIRKILIGVFAGVGGAVILFLALYVVRKYLSSSIRRARRTLADVIAGERLGTYKKLAEEDYEPDIPMNGHVS